MTEEYVKTGRKLTKLVCGKCGYQRIFDYRKRDKQHPKMKKHVMNCKGVI